jgi:hypothetical protein
MERAMHATRLPPAALRKRAAYGEIEVRVET